MTLKLSPAPTALQDKIVVPGDRRYRLLRSTYTTVASPAAVLLPENTEQVVAALRFAREQGLPLSVRSGGHGLSGRSTNDGGVVIDLSTMNHVEVIDRAARIVRVEAGARWAQVAQALAPYGLAISSGDHGNVGVGGLATGGGIGWLVRHYGLTIDHIRAAEVVLADGTVVRAGADHEPELLWAVRGAGAGVGIVVAFEIEAIELRDVGYAQIAVQVDRGGRALRQWADYMASAPRELSTAVTLLPHGRALVASITAVVADASEQRVRAAIEPLLSIGSGLLDHHARLAPYPALVSTAHLHANVGQQPSTTTNGLLTSMTDDDAAAITAAATGPHQPLIQMRSMGGAVNDMPADATAYAHRHHGTLVIASTFPPRRGVELDAAWRPLAERVDGAYTGFESRPDKSAFERIYPDATGDRVGRLWNRYDPEGIFRGSWQLS
ncbi:FAD/FMN-containing dehydrogenase [Nonomuraea polychroma]|uniref:FAD/FMN-containing dehydrogenase n=1 Tax=Nonomuraea polychroma TaxID=46176 RepID=A0A438MM77_9ACTN|nr:FAD-binding oxidoreductase [Nonomuraea polychroma]RVX46741.1 FAD/FMN-containing dehydrogenase [Nonomuraea polychroma]